MQEQEKEIFQNYEIKNWIYSPRLYKILGAAAIFNLLTLFVMGQGDMLTTRGCDSPMVSRVCQVLDTVYIGSVLLGTDQDYVDKDYEKTDLADAEITYIDVSGEAPPLTYPEGYFAIANPESQFAAMQNPTGDFTMTDSFPTFPSTPSVSSGTDLMNTPQVTPTPNNSAIQGKIPTAPFSFGTDSPPTPIRNRKYPKSVTPRQSKNNTSPSKLPKIPGDETVADNKPETKPADKVKEEPKSDPVADVEINKRPIKDLGVFVNALLSDEKIKFNLETPFIAKAKGKLTKEGKLDVKNFKIEATSPDENMVEVVKQSIEAINDAGYLQYLKMLSGKDLNMILTQDNESITAVVQSELESDTRAKSIKSGLDLAISLTKMKKTDPNDKDDLEILNSATIQNDGKKIIIKFAIPKAMAQEMIRRKLLEQTAATTTEPSSTMQNTNANLKTAK